MGKVVDAPASADSKVSCYNHIHQFSEVLNRYNALPIVVHPMISREKASPAPLLSLSLSPPPLCVYVGAKIFPGSEAAKNRRGR